MSTLSSQLDTAVSNGLLLASSRGNILSTLSRSRDPIVAASIGELVSGAHWGEINDRFFQTLAFGTGGLRGRTIGRVVMAAEQGAGGPLGRPEHPAVGTNTMNFFNMSRAIQGLAAYLLEWFAKEHRSGRPLLVFAHDTRHFSREFAAFAAKAATDLGCDAALFEGPRSTPELSFAVRYLGASAGAVITASHNPPHDNGFKAYFADGAQVVEPHASGIIAKVNGIESDHFQPVPEGARGKLIRLGEEVDAAYMDRLETLVLDPCLVRGQSRNLKIVFTPIHGTGGVITKPMLARLGFEPLLVPEQDAFDGRFPTVKSPNPENADALKMALDVAQREGADLVMATDPDCDRMGVICRAADGSMKLLTGNQIGSLLAYYRTRTFFAQGILTEANKSRGVIIKTFVTTDLQKAIAERAGLSCVETLTGFKYNGEKLLKYENAIPADLRRDYAKLPEPATRALRLKHSKFYVCGGEESYGYSACDFVRDKDGSGAVVMFAEVAAYAKSRGLCLDQFLDELFASHGYYAEKNASLCFEGAEGSAKITRLAASYADEPPTKVDGSKVVAARDFAKQEIRDSEGDLIPREKMLIVELADGRRFAVRPSGTEPKIKYYLFGKKEPPSGATFTPAELEAARQAVDASLETLWIWLEADANRRLG